MAATVQSVTSHTFASSPAVITKPSGLSVGDLMVAVLTVDEDTAITPPAGWTTEASYNLEAGNNGPRMYIFSNVADSADVAASNFSFASGKEIGGVLYRIDGHGPDLKVYEIDGGLDSDSGNTVSASVSVDTLSSSDVLICGAAYSGSTTASWTNYTVSGTNPTWTEQFDEGHTINSNVTFGVANSVYATATEITSVSAITSGDVDRAGIFVLSIPSQADASGTVTLLTNTNTIPEAHGRGDTIGSATLLTNTNTVNDVSVSAQDKTVWTNSTKPSDSTWTNSSK